MRVLLVNDYGTIHGGAEIATVMLRDGLRRRGHESMLFTSSARPLDIPSMADIECRGTISRYRTLLQTANPSAWRQLRRVLAQYRPDIVHVGMFLTQLSPLILPLLRDVPSVYQIHWLRPICPTGSKILPDSTPCRDRFGLACYRSGCLPLRDWVPLMGQMRLWWHWRSSFAAMVANSEATRTSLLAAGLEDVSVIPCAVASRPRRPPLGAVPTALFCGRLVREKGVHVLLQSWGEVVRQISNVRLLIAGDGPERKQLESMAPPGTTFLGHLACEELERVAGQAWVQVVPSIWQEGFGLAAAEAMARGTAVIASRTGGLPELVRASETTSATGRLVAPNDRSELAASLIETLGDRALCERLGDAGHAVACERFSEEAHVESFLALYRRLIAARSVKVSS
jgi:glycosyltransferase involved in cell wall biosynthesis